MSSGELSQSLLALEGRIDELGKRFNVVQNRIKDIERGAGIEVSMPDMVASTAHSSLNLSTGTLSTPLVSQTVAQTPKNSVYAPPQMVMVDVKVVDEVREQLKKDDAAEQPTCCDFCNFADNPVIACALCPFMVVLKILDVITCDKLPGEAVFGVIAVIVIVVLAPLYVLKLMLQLLLMPLNMLYKRCGGTGAGFSTSSEIDPLCCKESCIRQACGKSEAKRGESMWENYKYLVFNTHPLISLITVDETHPINPFGRLGTLALLTSFGYFMACWKELPGSPPSMAFDFLKPIVFGDNARDDTSWWYQVLEQVHSFSYSTFIITIPQLVMESILNEMNTQAFKSVLHSRNYFPEEMKKRAEKFKRDVVTELIGGEEDKDLIPLRSQTKTKEDDCLEWCEMLCNICGSMAVLAKGYIFQFVGEICCTLSWAATGYFIYHALAMDSKRSSLWMETLKHLASNLFLLWFLTGFLKFAFSWKYEHWMGRRLILRECLPGKMGGVYPPLPEAEQELARLFCLIDKDGSNSISLNEMQDFFNALVQKLTIDGETYSVWKRSSVELDMSTFEGEPIDDADEDKKGKQKRNCELALQKLGVEVSIRSNRIEITGIKDDGGVLASTLVQKESYDGVIAIIASVNEVQEESGSLGEALINELATKKKHQVAIMQQDPEFLKHKDTRFKKAVEALDDSKDGKIDYQEFRTHLLSMYCTSQGWWPLV